MKIIIFIVRHLFSHCLLHTVGKTSIITRFMYDNFDTKYQVRVKIKKGLRVVLVCICVQVAVCISNSNFCS